MKLRNARTTAGGTSPAALQRVVRVGLRYAAPACRSLAAGHLQGPAKHVTTDTDHLLSLVPRKVSARQADGSSPSGPDASGAEPLPSGPWPSMTASGPSGGRSPLSSPTPAAVSPDSTTRATAETVSSSFMFITLTPWDARP